MRPDRSERTYAGPLTRDKAMKAQDDLTVVCHTEFQLELQTIWVEHLRYQEAVRSEQKELADSLCKKIQEELKAAYTENAELRTLINRLRLTAGAFRDRVHGVKGKILRLNVDEKTHRKTQIAIGKDLSSVQEAWN